MSHGWRLATIVAIAVLVEGCGSRCKTVESARAALRGHPVGANRGADVRVIVPFDRANALFEELLRAQPIEVPLDVPAIGPLEGRSVTAIVREVRLQPGEPGKVRFATRIDVREPDAEIASLDLVGEIKPELVRDANGAELSIGLGPENLLAIKPALGPDAKRSIGGAVSRWLPARVRERVPQVVLDAAATKLGEHLTGTGYEYLQKKLLSRLGEVTRVRLRLPDVPIASTAIRSTPQLLVVDILTDLPVRRGLAAGDDTATDVTVRMSGSAVAELANWAIEHGHAPRWYNRTVEPKADGEFRPRFDYVAEDRAHPFKVYSFQERGGCSFHRMGVRAAIALDGDQLKVTALDRDLEAQSANPVIEAAAWTKYFLVGSLDRSKRVAAHTQFVVGGRKLETRVVGAEIAGDEIRFALRFSQLGSDQGR